ncbi:carboxypeptidase-like regulatory domain-containing protein [candidate division KSB1 bacterium]|nr:carboxypeptidase-like regulatory domain-containing protein [candidate division KSB1 bacterium]
MMILISMCLFYTRLVWPGEGSITGIITNEQNEPLASVNISVEGTHWGTATDEAGNFTIENMSAGTYSLMVSHIGYESVNINNIVIADRENTNLQITLKEIAIRFREIIVTPGNFAISRDELSSQQDIRKEHIKTLPGTLNDINRVFQIMPGIGFTDDFNAQFQVRGGKINENLIIMDGVEIFDPYHMKEIGGAVGVMNMDLIENVTVMTGGFSAKYGDKLSSVVEIENRQAQPRYFAGKVAAGGTGLDCVLEGAHHKFNWITSFRKSLLKEAAELINPTDYTFSPSFYDVQAKLVYQANFANTLTANFLYSRDNSYLEKWRQDEDIHSNYGNGYYGIVWQCAMKKSLISKFRHHRKLN